MSESELQPLKARPRPERMGISENTEAVYKSLNPIFKAWMSFKSGNYEECGRICDERVSSEDIGHPLWQIKVAALTEDARIIDEDLGESTVSEEIFGEQVMQKTARPGTSLKTAKKAEKTGYNPNSASVRPQTGAGPMTGYARPGTSTRPGTGKLTTAEGLKTARVATAALRPMTNLGRSIQTAALDPIDGPYIKTSRLNIPEIAKDPSNAKFLFDYITTVLADYRTALSLAEAAALEDPSENYWSYAQSISYLRLGMSRKAEEHAKAYASKTIDPAGAILLSAVYKKLDQPTAACEALKTGLVINFDLEEVIENQLQFCHHKKGLERCPTSLDIMATQARLEQARQNHERGDEIYSDILKHDPVNQEALCVLGKVKKSTKNTGKNL
jgi:tetratricopeptide repeat protein 8